MHYLIIVLAIFGVFACALTGVLWYLQTVQKMIERDLRHGIVIANIKHVAVVVGSLAGLAVGVLGCLYLVENQGVSFVAWLGRFSYVLIICAASSHVLVLIHAWLHIKRELFSREPSSNSLSDIRMERLKQIEANNRHYIDVRTRDDEVIDDLVGFVSEPIFNARRDMTRLPLYGYLGTVCGILLMAQELGRIDEASQTFRVLSSMATGLVLAFKTTLVALLAYLPLRKVVDLLLKRLAELEQNWRRQCEEFNNR
ncbi:MAG: MotA/TolQ/ExbB proton channel family protein [Candidatus Latescibacterota bacterium]|nr:MotA/TolQ/ExbB proton channel family protein [Candidatus Latescibacterota bacterium]